jgi:hypothetical protein
VIESLAKFSMVGLLAVATPVQSADPTLWAQWGLAGIVVAYVLWRDHQRERRLSTAIESQQKWIRDTLLSALERNAKAMERMAGWMERDRQEATRGDHA